MDDAVPTPAVRRVDVALALAVLVVVIIGTSQIEPEPGARDYDALAFLCGIIGAAALAFWRRWTIAAFAVVATAITVYVARNYEGGPALLPGPLALLALGYRMPRRTAWAGAAVLAVATGAGRVIADETVWVHELIFVGWASAAVLAGQALGARGERAAAERERVVHAHDRALADERLRIARDVHDSVAHAMATINVQSGVAAHLIDRQPAQAAQALEAIRSASADALDELGAILGVLRDTDARAPRTPIASPADLAELIERARADGLAVTFATQGDSSGVVPTVGVALFRVVQEALTNARRHAGPRATARVDLDVSERGAVRVCITDDGGGRESASPRATIPEAGGFGLVGMRERVESSGGTLDARPSPTGGFRVLAEWPERTTTSSGTGSGP